MKTEERKTGDHGPASTRPLRPRSEASSLGEAGEVVALNYLKKHGYTILARNYENKIGEIDIIAQKGGAIIFVEVKAQDVGDLEYDETGARLYPERSVDWRKQKKLIKTAEYYLLEKDYDEDTNWQIDVIGVDLDELARSADLRHLKNAVERWR